MATKNAYIVSTIDDETRLDTGFTNRVKAMIHMEEMMCSYCIDGYHIIKDEETRLFNCLRYVLMKKGKKKLKITLTKLPLQ